MKTGLFSLVCLFLVFAAVSDAKGGHHKRRCYKKSSEDVYEVLECSKYQKCCGSQEQRYCSYHCEEGDGSHEIDDDDYEYERWAGHHKMKMVIIPVVVAIAGLLVGVMVCCCVYARKKRTARAARAANGVTNDGFKVPLGDCPPPYSVGSYPDTFYPTAPTTTTEEEKKVPL